MDDIHRAASDADVFVLNGDIFDFRWTTFDTIEDTVDEAIMWLDRFVSRFPHCEFHYVLGNHDCVEPFTEALDKFASETPNLEWHPYYVTMGKSVFLHGDVAHKKMTPEDLDKYRERWKYDRKKGKVANRVYDAAFKVGVHKAIHYMASPTRAVVEHVRHYLEHVGAGPSHGTERVYFGHTHVPVDYELDGVRYQNCGAPLRGLEFNVLRAEVAA